LGAFDDVILFQTAEFHLKPSYKVVDEYIDGASKVSLADFRCTIFIKKDS
jgi:hypothetical protein